MRMCFAKMQSAFKTPQAGGERSASRSRALEVEICSFPAGCVSAPAEKKPPTREQDLVPLKITRRGRSDGANLRAVAEP
jgi:hypothetical protein